MEKYEKANLWQYFLRLVNLNESGYISENIKLLLYALASFAIPMFLQHPQVIIGTVVNMLLILSALHLKGKNLIPIIVFPSLGVLAGGILFGGITASLVYLIPFIWIGNAIMIFAFKYFNLEKKNNFFLTLGISSIGKVGFILCATFVLVSLSIVPEIFLVAMGMIQLVTALVGGILAFTIKEIKL